MRIYRMTATFGKLEHETLTLQPGLNIITAPNEWGKSTWCAFLAAMLYGMDTRAKTTRTALADKEHYAPWSGLPMEGRIDLNWNGRDITLERKTKRRVPLGDFLAYETKTGLPVPELTAANCGQQLLGVEQSVFLRSSFIRHADLPVTEDEALRRRLNALVTTGDESGAADKLADTLKELRNKCRYNRSGLLPQAETQRDMLESRLSELDSLEIQCKNLKERIAGLRRQEEQLRNHRQALEYTAGQDHAQRVAQARDAMESAEGQLQQLEEACSGLPSAEEAEQTAASLKKLQLTWDMLQMDLQKLPGKPVPPVAPLLFSGMTLGEARKMVHRDTQEYVASKRYGISPVLILLGLLGIAAAGFLIFLESLLFAIAVGSTAVAALIWGVYEALRLKKKRRFLQQKYGSPDSSRWSFALTNFEKEQKQYFARLKAYNEASQETQTRLNSIQDGMDALCNGKRPEEVLDACQRAVSSRNSLEAARQEAIRAQNHFAALQAMSKAIRKPSSPDSLTHSEFETSRLLTECTCEQQRLQNLLSQYRGRMDTLGDRTSLESQLAQKRQRIVQLEDTYAALVIALETLTKAREELQRRFAPRIAHRAQELMAAMTDGRYRHITMDTHFSLRAGTAGEDTLREFLWRSDGTMDQLYLSLRLAVSEALTPDAPLILDDALVRFDDKRMRAAVDILQEMAGSRQVILFTCQGREIIS